MEKKKAAANVLPIHECLKKKKKKSRGRSQVHDQLNTMDINDLMHIPVITQLLYCAALHYSTVIMWFMVLF